MKQRPGGFPTIKRPAPPPAAAAVEAKPVDAAAQVRCVPPAPAAVKYDAPHTATLPAPPPLPVDEFVADGDHDAGMDGSGELFPEPLYDDDDAPIITEPLPPPPRPEPTILHPTP